MRDGLLPASLDLYALPSDGAVLEGSLDPASLHRLGSAVERVIEAAARVEARPDPLGHVVVVFSVDARVELICQRCMQAMTLPLESASEFALGSRGNASENDAEEIGVTDGRVDVHGVVEDELILALPAVARHDDWAACRPESPGFGEAAEASTDNPFSVLASLRGQRDDTDDTDSGEH